MWDIREIGDRPPCASKRTCGKSMAMTHRYGGSRHSASPSNYPDMRAGRATYVDRGQVQSLRQATVSASGRRTPGLRLDDPRLLALWQALTCFIHLLGHGTFRTKDLLPEAQRVLNQPDYKLSQLRYDLGKLRCKGLVQRLPSSQRYQLTPEGYRLAILYSKIYHRLLAPLT